VRTPLHARTINRLRSQYYKVSFSKSGFVRSQYPAREVDIFLSGAKIFEFGYLEQT